MKDNQSDVALKADEKSIEEQAYDTPKYKPALQFKFDHSKYNINEATGVDVTGGNGIQERVFDKINAMGLHRSSEAIEAFFNLATQADIEIAAINYLMHNQN